MPLDLQIRSGADEGNPLVIQQPQSALAQNYRTIVRLTAARLDQQNQQQSNGLPALSVED